MEAKRDGPAKHGLLSNVFGFVSREIGSFMASAVSGSTSSRTSPLSRTKFFEKSYRYKDEQARRRRKKKGGAELAGTGESLRASKSMGSRPERDNDVEHELEGPAAGTRRKASTRRSARGSSPSRAHPSDTTTSHPSQPDEASQIPVTPVPQPPRTFLKAPPVTMPGALFPRSPSLEPGYASALEVLETDRRVQFAPEPVLPRHRTYSDLLKEAEESGGPVTPSFQAPKVNPPKLEQPPSSKRVRDPRKKTASSTKVVVEQVVDADHLHKPSNPSTSSRRTAAPSVRIEEEVPSPEAPQPLSSKAKGKQRATEWDIDFEDADTSGARRVRGKVQELMEAREEHMRKEQDMESNPDQSAYLEERERDKERIKALEAEVIELKQQLAQQRSNPADLSFPPPPTAPPPPDASTFLPTLAQIRNRTGGSAAATESFLLTARASLKPTAPPIEAPINPVVYGSGISSLARTRRTGHPTINLPTEKMASFLNEVKSAKLKKISSSFISEGDISERREGRTGPPPIRPLPEEVGNVSIGAGMGRDILRDMARRKSLGASLRGEKRKRGVEEESSESAVAPPPVKRRHQDPGPSIAPLFSDSSASSFASTSATINGVSSQPWPSILTDLTTPSLTSDNENEGENSPPQRLPATPPLDVGQSSQSQSTMILKDLSQHISDIHEDVDTSRILLPTETAPQRPPSPPFHISELEQPQPTRPSAFKSARRIPSSPMPSGSGIAPKKPTPPGRIRAIRSKRVIHSEDEHEKDEQEHMPEFAPMALKFSPVREPEPAPAPVAKPKSRSNATRIPKKQKADGASKSSSRAQSARTSRDTSVVSVASTSALPNTGRERNGGGASTSQIPRAASSSSLNNSSSSMNSNHSKRRRMLDEEIQRVGNELWSFEYPEADDGEHGEDDGVLTAVGTKSKRKGFLSGGGGGGIPVFMGVGYVEGAEDVDMDVDEFRDEGFENVKSSSKRKRGENSKGKNIRCGR